MHLDLFEYQKLAADWVAQRERCGLHDEMGIGKTPTTIGAMDRAGVKRGMIIAPGMLRENWCREIKRFSTQERSVCKGRNIHDYIAWMRGRFDILVTSYEQGAKWAAEFAKEGEILDFVAFDEAHYLKNPETKRTRALLGFDASGEDGLVEWACQSWHITGTPMANDPMDVYTFLRFCRSMDFGSREFARHFFNKTQGAYSARHSVKPEAQADLQALIRNNSIRRTHADVGLELPEIWIQELLVEGSTIELEKAMDGYPYVEEAIVEAIQTGDVGMLDASYIAIVRRLVGKAKAVAYADLLRWELDAGAKKRVVFCWHTEPLLYLQNYLRKHGYGVVSAYGSTSEADRQEAVRRFMEDDDTQVFIGNIRVAGTGLTLTSANQVDMLESDWSPSGNAQAIKRVHRIGQRFGVTARFITLADSIDVMVNKTVASKTADIAAIEGHQMAAAPLT